MLRCDFRPGLCWSRATVAFCCLKIATHHQCTWQHLILDQHALRCKYICFLHNVGTGRENDNYVRQKLAVTLLLKERLQFILNIIHVGTRASKLTVSHGEGIHGSTVAVCLPHLRKGPWCQLHSCTATFPFPPVVSPDGASATDRSFSSPLTAGWLGSISITRPLPSPNTCHLEGVTSSSSVGRTHVFVWTFLIRLVVFPVFVRLSGILCSFLIHHATQLQYLSNFFPVWRQNVASPCKNPQKKKASRISAHASSEPLLESYSVTMKNNRRRKTVRELSGVMSKAGESSYGSESGVMQCQMLLNADLFLMSPALACKCLHSVEPQKEILIKLWSASGVLNVSPIVLVSVCMCVNLYPEQPRGLLLQRMLLTTQLLHLGPLWNEKILWDGLHHHFWPWGWGSVWHTMGPE